MTAPLPPLPLAPPAPVVEPGAFVFAAAHLDHGHIGGQCNGLIEAGGTLRYVYDPDPAKVARFLQDHPGVQPVRDLDEILEQPEVRLVAAAAIPNRRAEIGCRVMRAGKDYFTDKAPFTARVQLEEARRVARETGRKYFVYFSERLHSECSAYALRLIQAGVIGRVLQITGLGPHGHGPAGSRPDWFYRKEQFGGILCDIGSHQVEQYLAFAGAADGRVVSARVANHAHPQHPEFEDFGEALIEGDNGTSFFCRVDWFTPRGLRAFGDGRAIILGTEGFIELRKYVDLARETRVQNTLYLVTHAGEQRLELTGKVGHPFFGAFIRDCLERTERAMTQEHVFRASDLCLRCQELADSRRGPACPAAPGRPPAA